MIKALGKKLLDWTARGLSRTPLGIYAYEQVLQVAMDRRREVSHGSNMMSFAIPNRLTEYRARSFETKEPDTLDWIDSFAEGEVLWDVGANIGLYSIYAAKARNCEVYAFEPSVFNLELLARNIFHNKLQRRVTIVPIALSDSLGPKAFQMTSTALGGALSTFGAGFDQNGELLKDVFEYRTIGLSMNEAVTLLGIAPARHVKIDVDGLEHFILRGGSDVLKAVGSVLVEINDAFSAQAEESARCLEEAGLSLYKRCEIDAKSMFNQWWVRNVAVTRRRA